MNYHQTREHINFLLKSFESSSLISDEGKLIASQDLSDIPSTTSRLVIFQIVKRYLNPQIGDLFIVNDPENGGIDFKNIFFVTRLTEKVFLVFVRELSFVDFKIPPTPLFESWKKNKMIWPFLVEQHPSAIEMAGFFEKQLSDVEALKTQTQFLEQLGQPKALNTYFKIISEIFDRHFNNRAFGQNELVHKLTPTEIIKVKLTIDDRQNQKIIYADFSQSSPAQKMSAASHIIESCLIKAIADYYSLSDLLSQPLLDHIRLTLPPQSIISKAHPTGQFNLLLQKVVSEQIEFLLNSFTQRAKKPTAFKLTPEFKFDLQVGKNYFSIYGNQKKIVFPDFDQLIQKQILQPEKASVSEGKVVLSFKLNTENHALLKPKLAFGEFPPDFLTVSGKKISTFGLDIPLKLGDQVELRWKIN